jgi:hypothetical protein
VRAAGGSAVDDVSRLSRARSSHWAPQLRGQAQLREDERTRNGEFRLAPLHELDEGTGTTWSVVLAWDFSQVVFAREETQLALAHAHLARVRREAAEHAAGLWLERRRAKALWTAAAPGPERTQACFAVLQLTAELDALTSGLFREAVSAEEAACTAEEKP